MQYDIDIRINRNKKGEVNIMNETLVFSNRLEFHAWLEENRTISKGVCLMFGKKGGPVTLSANEALFEVL